MILAGSLTAKKCFLSLLLFPSTEGWQTKSDGVVVFAVCHLSVDSHFRWNGNGRQRQQRPPRPASWTDALTVSRLSLTRAPYSSRSSPSTGGESRHNKFAIILIIVSQDQNPFFVNLLRSSIISAILSGLRSIAQLKSAKALSFSLRAA